MRSGKYVKCKPAPPSATQLEAALPVDRGDRRLAFGAWARRVPREAKRRMGKCSECARRFQVWFVGQHLCMPCAAERKRRARARVQPELPLPESGR